MKLKLSGILIWTVIWALLCIALAEFLPSHPHVKYATLLSPFILVTALMNPSELFEGTFPSSLYFGVFYWFVAIAMLITPNKLIIKSK
ncbi:MAG: hypothetical protein COB04_14395 [Gammaproteobacteria bacterium]|nr:MAG: hypothetical protein COB04_14395 [Gammaproteobacteria bacterium]